jgi:phospholipid/cholesterol/gamma-HCH transport system substrate-binding protein
LAQISDLLRLLAAADSTFNRLLSDPKLYANISDGVAAFSHAAARLDRIMADVALFADKIARHPELLGVSGAVQPSSGIKR